MDLSDKAREAAFPVHVDLGREESSTGNIANPVEDSPGGKKGKPRIYYPTLYIDSADLPFLPKEGCMLVEFRRKRMSVEEGSDGEDTTGVTLEIQRLCLPENMDDGDDMETAMKKFANAAGVDAGEETGEETDDDESEE